MTKFLKLTKLILNTNDIQKINIKPNKFYIHFIGKQFSGNIVQMASFGLGSISSDNYEIEVCETLNPDDYKIVSEWINNIT